jgi:lipoprotein-anchoring transpeptidase ErfK/SrfK
MRAGQLVEDRGISMNRRYALNLLLYGGLVTIGPRQALAELYPINKNDVSKVPERYRKTLVNYTGGHEPGTIVVDVHRKYLYLVQPNSKAMRYGIGVGKQGFSWEGEAIVRRKAEWPKWTPPAEMVERDPLAAEWANGMPGGPDNPLGARALYLFQGNVDTLYRIHGTAVPSSIGQAVSSGCIRLLNVDVVDLFERVPIGARVLVLQDSARLDDGEIENQKKRRPSLFSLFKRKPEASQH